MPKLFRKRKKKTFSNGETNHGLRKTESAVTKRKKNYIPVHDYSCEPGRRERNKTRSLYV